ncbi:hypothetical protein TELCIR_03148, partial [Teladorsagia circumcincta]
KMIVLVAAVWCALVAQALSRSLPSGSPAGTCTRWAKLTKAGQSDEVEKRFHYLDIPTARFVEERDALREILRRIPPELRQKRFEGLADYVALEDPNAKRSSLKRLAILSARGFGRK